MTAAVLGGREKSFPFPVAIPDSLWTGAGAADRVRSVTQARESALAIPVAAAEIPEPIIVDPQNLAELPAKYQQALQRVR